uniref:Reverse transcriptase domain-containing protein n=1 Tax=Tanacetum cinerariifolium TaxID=118510 RepID=A0A699ILM9_TANCI|nr:hypothetical protein [Tanacetum cinerariifolium]
MWERIKRLMFDSDVTSHVRHLSFMDEFDKFAAKEVEALESMYERLTKLVNIMDLNNVCPILVSINTNFPNCLQPEWSKYFIMERFINIVKNNISDDSTNDPLLEEIDLFLASDNSIPPGIENFAYDSEGDIRFLEELLIDDSILFLYNEHLILITRHFHDLFRNHKMMSLILS